MGPVAARMRSEPVGGWAWQGEDGRIGSKPTGPLTFKDRAAGILCASQGPGSLFMEAFKGRPLPPSELLARLQGKKAAMGITRVANACRHHSLQAVPEGQDAGRSLCLAPGPCGAGQRQHSAIGC